VFPFLAGSPVIEMKNGNQNNEKTGGQPPKLGIARELYELAEDDDVDVDELLADARDGDPDE